MSTERNDNDCQSNPDVADLARRVTALEEATGIASPNRTYSTGEAARILGVSRQTIGRWATADGVAHRVGRNWRIPASWVDAHKTNTTSQENDQ